MGVETPIPPEMMDPAAPDGAPPRRIKTVEKNICRFSYFECELPFMLVSTEQKKAFYPENPRWSPASRAHRIAVAYSRAVTGLYSSRNRGSLVPGPVVDSDAGQ